MMTQLKSEQDDFQSLLERLYQAQSTESNPLQKVRDKAWDHFLELGLPSRKNEVFRYVKLRNLYSREYLPAQTQAANFSTISAGALDPYIYPECSQSVLVFVNGYYQPTLSRTKMVPEKVVIASLNDAMKTYGTLLSNQWAKSIKEETDPFAALNMALHSSGVFLYIPPKTLCKNPLQILHVVDTKDQNVMMMPRLQVFAGAHAEADIISSHAVLSGKNYFINQATEVALEENSRLRYMQSNFHADPDVWHFDALRANLKRDSSFKTVSATEGSIGVRNDYRAALIGENAEALLNGVCMLKGKQEAHVHVLMDHQAPNCRSMQLYKGALNDFSHSSFEGKILVRQAAQKTEAFQLNNNLLLSDRANAESKPNLEIFADDVKASHGATVGQLDKEELFYLKTRGFSESAAKNLLIYGFCKEVIDLITVPSLLEEITLKAQRYLTKV